MENGKLSKAADQLGMTQPAVSNALNRLRLTFNDDLFIRTRQGMIPTANAHQLIIPIRDALNLIGQAIDPDNKFSPSDSERTFTLALGDYGELILLPSLLKAVNQAGEKLAIKTLPELHERSLKLLKQGQLDFYFDYQLPNDKQLESCRLTQDEVVVIAHKNHPRIQGELNAQQYLAERHIILSYRHKQRTMLKVLVNQHNLKRKIMAEVCQYTAVPNLVAQTEGLGTVPKRMATYFCERLPLNVYTLPFDLGLIPAYLVWNKALNQDKGHQWLKSMILQLTTQDSSLR